MRYIFILILLIPILYADQCQEFYALSQKEHTKVNALIKNNIPSNKAYEVINHYLDLASSTIAECSLTKETHGFRITRELSAEMKRISSLRESFRVQSFNELKEAAMIQAKQEVQCTNVYNNTYIRRPKDDASIQPISK